MDKLNNSKDRQSFLILFSGLLIALLIGFLDYISGSEISFSIFYLIPILFVTWYTNKVNGILLAIFSGLVWLYVEVFSNTVSSSTAIQYWNAMVRLGFFFVTVYLLSAVKKLNLRLEEKVENRTNELTKEIVERKKAELNLKEKSDRLRQLAKGIQNIREEENSRIARELHDELGQSLTAIKIELAWLAKKHSNDIKLTENLVSLTEVVDDTIHSVQKISSRIRPKLLDELGLYPAMERYLREFQGKTGVRCNFVFPKEDGIKLSKPQATSVYRIFQEAMTNISRHAKASATDVIIIIDNNETLVLKIKDNGVGLKKHWQENSNSLGVLGMHERAEMSGGSLSIESEENNGTEVIAKIPLSKLNSKNDD